MTRRPLSNDVPDLVREIGNELSAQHVDEAQLKAEYLVCEVIGVRRLSLFLDKNRMLTDAELEEVHQGLKRLVKGEPLQYVIGHTEFMGHEFKTDRRALIPRPETEELVGAVLDCTPLWTGRPRIADVGTGTGCIVVALAIAHPEADYIATDISPRALSLAKENARTLPITFLETDLLAGIENESLDAVVSNPPYIASEAIPELEVHIRDHEPVSALDGGPVGTEIIAELADEAARALKPGGRIFLEIGEDQAAAVRAILRVAGFQKIRIEKDISGNPRIAMGVK